MSSLFKGAVYILIVLGFVGFPGYIFASSTDGTINDTYKYAWSDQIGWLNFAAERGNVHIKDTEITGYVWSDNYGWIALSPSTSGVKNNGEGTLSGSAWGEETGWIDFSGVTIDSAGIFRGTASGDIVGTINFNCNNCRVQTDWIPSSLRSGGGLPGPGGGGAPLPAPLGPYSVSINNKEEYTNTQIVELNLNAGSDVKRVEISNTPGFENVAPLDYQETKSWDLCQDKEEICANLDFPPAGLTFTVYVKFYTAQGVPSEIVSDNIIFDKQIPAVEITNIKQSYDVEEDIVVSGTSEAGIDLFFAWGEQYGLGRADSQGNWFLNFGKMAAGDYQLNVTAKDLAGNSKGAQASFSVKESVVPTTPPPPPPPTNPVTNTIKTIQQIIGQVFGPKPTVPAPVITVPKIAQAPLKGKWVILPRLSINNFVLGPLPTELRALAQKFSGLQNTFQEIGVLRATDIERLKSATLVLPNLTEITAIPGAQTPIPSLPKGVPLAKLTTLAKERIPSEVVFARTAGELVDFNIAVSLSSTGAPVQVISTLVSNPLELAVKPEKPVTSVKGYLIFKSKRQNPGSSGLPFERVTASAVSAGPAPLRAQETPVQTEDDLVLIEFEYTDPDGDGIYTANIQSPMVGGEYEIVTVMDYSDSTLPSKAIRMITVVDPEGYVYEKAGLNETRINGSVVSLHWLNPETKRYELWLAKEYNQQNPQTTDASGSYAFLVPEGTYQLRAGAKGYKDYESQILDVREGEGIHLNIQLERSYSWLSILVDWKTAVMVLLMIFLAVNFYLDRRRKGKAVSLPSSRSK